MTPGAPTADQILAALPPFERVTARRAVRAVVEATHRGLTLTGAAREATARLAAERRHLAEASDAAERQGLARLIARHELEARCALLAAHRLGASPRGAPAVLTDLAVDLAADPSWRVVVTAFDVLRAEAEATSRVPPGARDQALATAGELRGPVWSQVAAWRFLAATAHVEGGGERELVARQLAARLARGASDDADDLAAPALGVDDVFVRAEVARLLGRGPASVSVPALERAARDPSEHVRMTCAAALGSLGAVPSLVRFAQAASEASPAVRAAATLALAPLAPEALRRVLLDDPCELPRRAALEEAEPLALGHDGLRAAIDALAVAAPWPHLAALAADAAERLHHRRDVVAARILERLRDEATAIPPGASRELVLEASRDQVGRALAVLAAADHGFAAEHRGGGRWRLARGETVRRRAWRVLHELLHPSPDKRQGHRHTTGRVGRGEVRAPTGVLAEISPTRVPGERVFLPAIAGWGRHVPAVDDLLDRPRDGEIAVFSSLGVTRLRFPAPADWPRARARVSLAYARLSRLRRQSLEGADANARGVYARALGALGFRLHFHPHRALAGAEVIDLFSGTGTEPAPSATPLAAPSLLTVLPATGVADRLSSLFSIDLSGLHTANQVAAIGAVALGLMGARLYEARREIDRARASIPLSIGGWGTRGKSGTERLKAALFQALGCEVFAKTTGCEAMFLHAIPGQRAEEILLYRTYDKATIWEQRDILRLASRLGVDVFLWECMALNPAYVDILEGRWMRDDLCTLTNAYPDHENVQGPSGLDVARVMAEFIPRGKTLVTAEDQMLPLLRDVAAGRGAHLLQVGWRDVDLLPEDLLARFPYREHPRNIALVVTLAAELGVERDVALKEMADWIVPDLGVLQTYPEATWRGRRLEFSNGMSANERTGFLGNWSRLRLDDVGPDTPATWVVTVVNNRGDRNARSAVFADIVARDIAAHRHVVIGTNVRGFARAAEDALRRSLAEVPLLDAAERSLPAEERTSRALKRAGRVLARLALGALGPERLAREARDMAVALGAPADLVDAASFSAAFALERGASGGASAGSLGGLRAALAPVLEPRLAALGTALGAEGPDAVAHLVELATRHVAVLRWQAEARAALAADAPGADGRVDGGFRELVVAIFRASLVLVDDPATTGDQVIDRLARAVPPGFRARIMGAQNIKGTGLDFAYRWVALDRTVRALATCDLRDGAADEDALAAALDLLARDDLGILDCEVALPALRRAAERAAAERAPAWREVVARLEARATQATSALADRAKRRRLLGGLERVLDVWDGVVRRARADRIVDELVEGRRSHAQTASAMRALVARQKGGWLGARPRRG